MITRKRMDFEGNGGTETMFGKHFDLNEQTIPVIEDIGSHMPGGFFIYKAEGDEELLYANQPVFDIYGCKNLEEFKELTGYTFKGMVHPDDYDKISASIIDQIEGSDENMDYAEYRIIRKDGKVRWVDDYGHYADSNNYGGLYYVFISDITERREKREQEQDVKDAVIDSLTTAYNTVFLIDDVETERCSLYFGDLGAGSIHAEAIRNALSHVRYTDTKTEYVDTMVAAEDRERMQKEISLPYMLEQFKDKDRFSVMFLRDLPDGLRYYLIDIAKVYMPGGRIGVMMGFRDVDDEIRENLELKEMISETREENIRLMDQVQDAARLADLMGSAASLLSNMPAMSFTKDAETGEYLACNQPFAEYAGKSSPEGVIGLTDHDMFDKDTADHFVEDDAIALSMDKPHVFFEDVPDAEGSTIRNLQTTKLKFVDNSGRLCTLGLCVDVTEIANMKTAEARQQQMEEKLALQEKLLEEREQRKEQDSMIIALSSDYRSVYYVNLDEDEAVCYLGDKRIEGSPGAGEHFPYLHVFTEYGMEHVDEEYREGYLKFIQPDNIREQLLKNVIISYRFLEEAGGVKKYSMLRMAGVRHAEDRTDHRIHAVGVGFTDIDEEMRQSLNQQKTLAEALAAAEQANRAKTAFLSNMSHEIRTPMNAIIGLDSLALRSEKLDDETREYLEKIGESARHLLGLINDILDMSRIESGRIILRREEFSFRSMLEQINVMVMSQCSEKGLKYECRMTGGVSDYYIGDDMKLKQVLLNILSNAIKFTDAPGSIDLDIERTGSFNDQSTLKFVIKDTGIGMDKAFIPKIFDSFAQEDSGRSSKYGSTGLGMAITKNIVELMNGTISVESEKGKGTTFTVIISLKNSDHQGPVVSYVKPKDMRVLVVDDEEVAAEHARLVLEEVGIMADTCFSGPEAMHMLEVQHVKHQPYNLVLLDWKMPDMDGLDVAREIRKLYDKETTVIILTSFNWDEIMDDAMHIGVDSFLAKPLFASNVIDEFERIARKNNMHLYRERNKAELKGRRILLAEDMPINAEIMKKVLSVKEMQAEHAMNGKIALDMFAESAEGYYDAVLMDVRMPEMDGLEATSRIRGLDRPDAKRVPIIAMTANAFDEDVQRSLQVGMNAHLSKPVETEHLYQTLAELIWEAENDN